jgi:hypothetical protein
VVDYEMAASEGFEPSQTDPEEGTTCLTMFQTFAIIASKSL